MSALQTEESLEQKIRRTGNPARMLRSNPSGFYAFPNMKPEHTSWQDEQEAWRKTAVLFDQSFHMTDVYFEGPTSSGCSPRSGSTASPPSAPTRPSSWWPAARTAGWSATPFSSGGRTTGTAWSGFRGLPTGLSHTPSRAATTSRSPATSGAWTTGKPPAVPVPAPGSAGVGDRAEGARRPDRPHQVLQHRRVHDRRRACPRSQSHDDRGSRPGYDRAGDDRPV